MRVVNGARLACGNVLVTGACGTVGSEVVRLLANNNIRVVGIDNNEEAVFSLNSRYGDGGRIDIRLGDVRDVNSIKASFEDVDTVIHCAALKHVNLAERFPMETVRSNLIGLSNVLELAIQANVKRIVFTSSDKAVNPTGVMGMTKALGEKIVRARMQNLENTKVVITRFGNVLGSRGSVVETYRNLLLRGEKLEVRDFGLTRFIMTKAQAAELVIRCATQEAESGIYIAKMPALRIVDLARAMIAKYKGLAIGDGEVSSHITVSLLQPGEKINEELMTEDEFKDAKDIGDIYFLPAQKNRECMANPAVSPCAVFDSATANHMTPLDILREFESEF